MMNTSGASTETLAFAGTLGDAFVVLCKLYNQYATKGKHFRLIRHSLRPEMDEPIDKMFKIVPFIEYSTSCQSLNNLEELYQAIRNSPYKVINTQWQKDQLETYPVDYENLNPYPVLQTPAVKIPHDRLNVGIQLHCGCEGANFRGFSLQWLAKVRKILPSKDFCIYLFGVGAACYPEPAIEDICGKCDIDNLIGKLSFPKWLSFIKSMDTFISLEGFATLFAMSQKVLTIEYNQYPCKYDGSICPVWRKGNAAFNMNSNVLIRKLRHWKIKYLRQDNLYSPANLRFIKTFIYKNAFDKCTE